jgi:hypothetical protein
VEEACGKPGEKTRKINLKRVALLLGIAGGMLLLIWLWTGNVALVARFGLPAVFALAVGFWLVAGRLAKEATPPREVTRDGEPGSQLEERYVSLPEGYAGFHRVSCGEAVVAFVAVGPAGVFVVESRGYCGTVTAQGNTLLLNGLPPEKNFLEQTWRETYRIRDFLMEQTGRKWPVKPVLCFPNAFVAVRLPLERVAVIGGQLAAHLAKQRVLLSPDSVALITTCLEGASASAGPGSATDSGPSFEP